MTAPTVTVTVNIAEMGGDAIDGAHVQAKMDKEDIYAGFVVAGTQRATSVGGIATLALFPNALVDADPPGLGTTGSSYQITITSAGGKTIKGTAVVPNVDCELSAIFTSDNEDTSQPRTLTGAVRYDVEQTLTEDQQAQARANIGSAAADVTVFGAAMLAWFNSLSTSLPETAGVLWNNGGTLSQS